MVNNIIYKGPGFPGLFCSAFCQCARGALNIQLMHELDPPRWIDRYSDLLFRFALLRINDREEARDLVQETFVAAWKGVRDFKGAASEKTWLLSILRNKVIDHYRKEARSPIDRLEGRRLNGDQQEEQVYFNESDYWRPAQYPRDWGISYGHAVEKNEFYAVLKACRDKLQRIQAAVFAMKYLDDLDSEDICKELNITSSNYWVLLHRAKLHLRGCLEKNWFKP
jgi:RNA polymerase sigma-70 factor (TIGR02943 family)